MLFLESLVNCGRELIKNSVLMLFSLFLRLGALIGIAFMSDAPGAVFGAPLVGFVYVVLSSYCFKLVSIREGVKNCYKKSAHSGHCFAFSNS